MTRKRLILATLALIATLLVVTGVLAAGQVIQRNVIASGELATGGGYVLNGTLGESVASNGVLMEGASYGLGSGFWGGGVVFSGAPLSIDKTVNPDTNVRYRGEVTYTVVLNNSGEADAHGVPLTDTLPVSTTFARWVAQAGASFHPGPPQEITWSGTVTGAEAITLTFVVSHAGDYGDVVTNTAEYSSTVGSGSDDASFSVIGPPGLSIDKTVNPDTNVRYRGEVTYTVVLNNSGEADAHGVPLTDTLPVSTTFARWVAQAGASFHPGPPQEITWSGTVTEGEAITITFVVSHAGDYGDVVTNTAEYSSTVGSGSDSATFTVGPVPLVYLPVIVKSD